MDRFLKLLPKQSLQMTQELQTALLILSLPISDLEEFYVNEIEKNPLYEAVYHKGLVGYENTYDQTEYKNSSYENLIFQAKCVLNGKDKSIAERILSHLNEKGFFVGQIKEIAKVENTTYNHVEKIRKILHELEPKGVGTYNPREFFLFQIEDKNTLIYQVIDLYYEDLLNQRFSKIAKKLKTTKKVLQKEIEEKLKTLKIFPLSSQEEVIWTRPDITVEDQSGKLQILINEEGVFPIKLNEKYEKILTNPLLEKEEKAFLKKALSSGKWLIKNVQIRNKTLIELTNHLIKTQKHFFLNGQKPTALTIKDVAADLNLSYSTVLRAINNKIIQTPFGLYPLKFFFNKGGESGSEALDKLKTIISKENKLKPFTDLELCNELQKQGVEVSRRCVAKYRKKLLISSASKRKKF